MTRTSQFDEISLAFGRIEEKLSAAVESIARIEKDVAADVEAIKTDVAALRQAVDKDAADLAALKNKGAGLLIGVAIAAGAIGAKFGAIIGALKGLFN